MEAPRVLRVITDLAAGAPAREAVLLMDDLRARGFDTRLAWGAAPAGATSAEPRAGVPNTYIPWLSSGTHLGDDARATAVLGGIVRRWRPDVIHTHRAKAGRLGRAAALRAHVPSVHTFYGDSVPGRIERMLAARTDALVATSTAVRDRLASMGVGTERAWHVVPIGVDLEPFLRVGTRAVPGRVTVRSRLGLPKDGAVVVNLGPLADHGMFLRAAGRIAAERPDTTFVVMSDEVVPEDFELDARSRLGERVRFLRRTDELAILFAACDVALSTSCGEDAPGVLIEAAAASIPVVAADSGAAGTVVATGAGELIPHGDHRAAAAAVGALLDDPARAAAFGSAGRANVRTRFSGERLAADLAGLYDDLLGRRSMVAAHTGALTSARGT